MSTSSDVKGNRLLAALAGADSRRWLSQLERVEMPQGQVLYGPGDPLSHAYFPTTAIASLLCVMENTDSSEMAVVGNEGFVGIALVLGGDSTPGRAVVHRAGHGFRLRAQAMKDELDRGSPVLQLMLCYVQALMTQMAQMALCNLHHLLDQQLCRWLLLSLDRQRSNELMMTQKLIAGMLGVRRQGVTGSALKLQQAGLIRYSRGRIEVLDREKLEGRACDCCALAKGAYRRMLRPKLTIWEWPTAGAGRGDAVPSMSRGQLSGRPGRRAEDKDAGLQGTSQT
ncbi:Crp/Fnr family transcriptional regulator [Variovorax sp. RT4R15]|uniref:Crp/Fnr family transcriptional regulator n=1 Tax=Variovorax sp. RT4R15 TaxID=3443737 RepID=UPI003F47BE47